MLFTHIDAFDENLDLMRDVFVGVRGATIAYVGAEPPADAASFGEAYDGRGRLLMPALYNAHAHAPMTLLRGYAENLRLQSWLNDRVFPFEARITPADARPATDLAIAEMVRNGVVSFSDMYYHDDARCEAVRDAGVKCNVSYGLVSFDETDYRATAAAAANDHLFATWDGACDGRIKVDMCIHAEYTNSEQVCRQAAEESAARGSILHVHVAETKAETEACRQRHDGLSPVAFLERCGAFASPVLAAHCVWVDEADMDVLAAHGASVACNPASNMKLASGFAPVPQMLARGINVAIGTDGPASNNAHDLFRDLYLFATVYKGASGDPTVVTPRQALFAATRAGAIAQGRADCGQLRVGARADLCVLDATAPALWPQTDMLANVVYAGRGSDVVLTMCDGRVVYRDGVWPTIDVERARAQTQAATQRIIGELAQDARQH